ncbi:hypothetical protein GCM10009616_37910 [Microlunatus lacustris]
MSATNCPACGYTFSPPESDAVAAPDLSVVQWFRVDPGWTGEASTDEIYSNYLRATEAPVSRKRFVADLAYLGIEEILDDDTLMLVRS